MSVPIPVEKIDLFVEIANEQQRALEKWGGQTHDDAHREADWNRFIVRFATTSSDTFRERMIAIAGLAISAIESHDRIKGDGNDTTGLIKAGIV